MNRYRTKRIKIRERDHLNILSVRAELDIGIVLSLDLDGLSLETIRLLQLKSLFIPGDLLVLVFSTIMFRGLMQHFLKLELLVLLSLYFYLVSLFYWLVLTLDWFRPQQSSMIMDYLELCLGVTLGDSILRGLRTDLLDYLIEDFKVSGISLIILHFYTSLNDWMSQSREVVDYQLILYSAKGESYKALFHLTESLVNSALLALVNSATFDIWVLPYNNAVRDTDALWDDLISWILFYTNLTSPQYSLSILSITSLPFLSNSSLILSSTDLTWSLYLIHLCSRSTFSFSISFKWISIRVSLDPVSVSSLLIILPL